ncbi:HNH endonuclease [Alishewanella sp. 16-MA]|uniref:HNH endonuclease n=1 Tax=Alishewanella maricola TaxID=2795740 RepID=A0ABS8C1R0_9ALTE|nr:HNH endonuclease signature motif containing protein [Alishewanella maricola]MCB5226238.1 HNH endonuclease [Alishewanella maricola]
MSRYVYTPAMLEFIETGFKKMGVTDLTKAFNGKFGLCKTPKQIKACISNHKFKCGRITGQIKKGVYKLFNAEQAKFIEDEYKNLTIPRLTLAFNANFKTNMTVNQIRGFTRNHCLKSGRTGQFKKGHSTWNAGMKGWEAGGRSIETRFKKGVESGSIKPIGSERICSKDGYIIIKIAMPNKWRAKHLVEWEKHNGPLPKGMRLWFKDNNRTNWHIDNLMLITRAQGAVINKLGFGDVPAELKPAAITLAEITMKRRQLTQDAAA